MTAATAEPLRGLPGRRTPFSLAVGGSAQGAWPTTPSTPAVGSGNQRCKRLLSCPTEACLRPGSCGWADVGVRPSIGSPAMRQTSSTPSPALGSKPAGFNLLSPSALAVNRTKGSRGGAPCAWLASAGELSCLPPFGDCSTIPAVLQDTALPVSPQPRRRRPAALSAGAGALGGDAVPGWGLPAQHGGGGRFPRSCSNPVLGGFLPKAGSPGSPQSAHAWGNSSGRSSPTRARTPANSTRKEMIVDKRANAAKALARDNSMIEELLAITCESPKKRAAREQAENDRELEKLFVPIQKPLQYLPESCRVEDFCKLGPLAKLPDYRSGDLLQQPDVAEWVALCSVFAALVNPFVPAGEEPGPLVLSRPALCCLLIVLRFVLPADGKVLYHQGLELFDRVAKNTTVRGCSNASGAMPGLLLSEEKNERFAPVEFLERLLYMIASNDVSMIGDLKNSLFLTQMPVATAKAKHRLKYLTKRLALGKVASNALESQEPPLYAEGLENSKAAAAAAAANGSPRESAATNSRHTSKVTATSHKSPTRTSSEAGDTAVTRSIADDAADAASTASPKTSNNETEGEEIDAAVAAAEAEQRERAREEEQLLPEDALYAHTFTVVKGELLTLTLLEPEVLHLVWMFFDVFTEIFQAYSDVSTSFLGRSTLSNGHMSRAAFMQFCIDFGMFPTIVDFNTLQCIYHCAESTVALTTAEITSCMSMDPSRRRFAVGQAVEILPTVCSRPSVDLEVSLKPGQVVQIIEICYEAESQACRVLTADNRKVWVLMEDIIETEKPFRFARSGDGRGSMEGLGQTVEWVSKDFDEMTDKELYAMSILSCMEDWMGSHKMRSRDVFAQINKNNDGHIGDAEFAQGLRSVPLEEPPTDEQVADILEILDDDGNGSLEYAELDAVLVAIRERKARHRKAASYFLKPDHEMTPSELIAARFFLNFTKALDAKSVNIASFFKRFDADESGLLGTDELVRAAEALGMTVTKEERDNMPRCIMIAGLNLNGALNLKEINRMINQAREAIAIKEREEANAANPFLALASGNDKMVRIFGAKAFIECVLKIGFSYLSFHGTVSQSELRSQAKVVWLITFLASAFAKHVLSNRILAKMHVTRPSSNLSENWSKFIEARTSTSDVAETQGTAKKQRGLSLFVAGMEAKGLSTRLSEMTVASIASMSKETDRAQSDSSSSSDTDSEAEAEIARRQEIADRGRTKLQNIMASRSYVAKLPPLKRLILNKPKLFSAAPAKPPKLRGENMSRCGPCPVCGCLPFKGWGAPSCSTCGLGDTILRACLVDEKPEELPVLHRILRAPDRLPLRRQSTGHAQP
mmetsp:Transcript_7115/g.17670  ORF Transcript_7115/g.17670 Transcript_7115/m.17670 type:complete len:1323 (+) Transcript_7115:24-3992(+)